MKRTVAIVLGAISLAGVAALGEEERRGRFIQGGNLSGYVAENARPYEPSNTEKKRNSGFCRLVHDHFPDRDILDDSSLNNEHLINALSPWEDDPWVDELTPRKDPCHLSILAPNKARIDWRAQESSWKVDQWVEYTLSGNQIDLRFRERFAERCWGPQEDRANWVSSFFASYIGEVQRKEIYFWGFDNRTGHVGWTAFGRDLAPGEEDFLALGSSEEDGTVKWRFSPRRKKSGNEMNTRESPDKCFLLPFYFGIVDGDGHRATTDDKMGYMVMFAPWISDTIQFSLFNWGSNPHFVAWDWQYTVRDPAVNAWCGYEARIVYRPIGSTNDLVEEYVRFVRERGGWWWQWFDLRLPEMPLPEPAP